MIPSLASPAEETLRIHPAAGVTHRVDAPHPAPAPSDVVAVPASVAALTTSALSSSPHPPDPLSAWAIRGEKLSGDGEELSTSAGSSGGTAGQAAAPSELAAVDSRFDYAALRSCHVEDLLDHLQRLSEEIDARSAKLHADIATHERRERAFRLWAQQHAQEILAQREQCIQQQAALQAQARRLAMTDSVIRA